MPEEIVKNFEAINNIAAALAIGIGTIGPGIGLGLIGQGVFNALGRNPEAAGRIMTTMMIMVAFTEALAIYALVISLIIKFT